MAGGSFRGAELGVAVRVRPERRDVQLVLRPAAVLAAVRLYKLEVAEVLRGCQVIGFGGVSRPWTPKRLRGNATDRGDRKRRDVAPARPHHRRLSGARKLIIPRLVARRVGCLRDRAAVRGA